MNIFSTHCKTGAEAIDITRLPGIVQAAINRTGATLSGSRSFFAIKDEEDTIAKLTSNIPKHHSEYYRKNFVIHKTETDWDFVIEYNAANIQTLTDLGFHISLTAPGYADSNTIAVATPLTPRGSDVQFIMKTDVELYNTVMGDISVDYYCTYIWKQSRFHEMYDSADTRRFILDTMNMLYTIHSKDK